MENIDYITSKPLACKEIGGGVASKALLTALLLGVTPAVAADGDLSAPSNDSLYTLNRVETAGENTITKFEYNSATGEFTPVYYRLQLNNTQFGAQDGDVELNFGWQTGADGNPEFVKDPANPVGQSIVYKYLSSVTQNPRLEPDDGEDVTGNFVGILTENEIYGGVILNEYHQIGDITSNFIDNTLISEAGNAGGVISSLGTVKSITGDFINNKAITSGSASETSIPLTVGGGIHNAGGGTDYLKGNFINNSVVGVVVLGGAIYNVSSFGEFTGNFIGNHAISGQNGSAQGGAIANSGMIGRDIDGALIDSSLALYTAKVNIVNNKTGEVLTLYSKLWNSEEELKQLVGELQESYLNAGYKFYDVGMDTIIPGDQWDLIKEQYESYIEQGYYTTTNELAEALGDSAFVNPVGGIENSSFIGNYAVAKDGIARGGAIYTITDLKLTAKDGYTSVFAGNYVSDKDGTRDEGIYVNGAELTLNTETGGQILMDDMINGYEGYSLSLEGDGTGAIYLNRPVTAQKYDENAGGLVSTAATINVNNGANVYLNNETNFDNNNLNMNGGFVSLINNTIGVSALNSMTVSADTDIVADVDLAAKEMDRFTAASYGEHTGSLNVVGMNILKDAVEGEDVTAVYFAEPGLKDHVTTSMSEVPDSFQMTAYTPIYKYNVTYDNENQYDGKGDGGYFLFTRGDKILGGGGSTGNDSDAFNPAVLATPVANLAAGQAAVNEAFKHVFEHADSFTQLPAMERYAKINANKYAINTEFNDYLPSYAEQLQNKGVWFRPYTTFESINLDNGPDVDAITYGSLVGFDGDFKEMKNGWHRVFTGYAGYMGSSLNYSGVDTTMNGGLLGFTETFYKGNFWTAITASAGASVGESHTMYGKEDYTSLLAGVGSKTGYNFEFKDGKFIIQPIMYLSYTFVNTFDYKNAAGVNIESDPLHTIQLNPSVRFIANLKGGWQPYASVGMVWNLMNESKVTANNVKLPEMSVKPYVEYGVGVQRNWADKFTAFLQAMIRNGGRNGIALTGGFRFMLGSDDDNSDKPKIKKEIKSL